MEKRYYWLKLQAGFFGSLRIKKLRRMKRGDTLLCIYLKMQLATLAKDGVLEYKGIEEDMAAELAFDLNEKVSDVRATLAFLAENGLIEQLDETHFVLPWVVANTGSETASTQRWRDWKSRKNDEMLDSNTPPTNYQRTANVEKEIEIDKSKSKRRYAGAGARKNIALDYKQTPISEEGFKALVVDLGKESCKEVQNGTYLQT